MTYFPMFIRLEGASCLVVGGGTVAFRKAQKLLGYGAKIMVVAPEISPGFLKLEYPGQVTLCRRAFMPEDISQKVMVIAATDSRETNREISEICHHCRIPVNVADDKDACTFTFPALVRRGSLSIGISTGGASPAAALYVKDKIDALFPEEKSDGSFEDILAYLARMRLSVKESEKDENRRKQIFSDLFDLCMEKKRPLTDEEFENIIRKEDLHETE